MNIPWLAASLISLQFQSFSNDFRRGLPAGFERERLEQDNHWAHGGIGYRGVIAKPWAFPFGLSGSTSQSSHFGIV